MSKERPTYQGTSRANSSWPAGAPIFRVHGQMVRGLTPSEAGKFLAAVDGVDVRLWEKQPKSQAISPLPRAIAADLERKYPTGDK